MRGSASVVVLLVATGCASPGSPTSPTPTDSSSSGPKGVATTTAPSDPIRAEPQDAGGSGVARKTPIDASAIFMRMKQDLVRCYEQGKKATPTMLDGKLTLNASIEASGRTSCVIPTEDTGLTQEVEDCMSARFAKETFDASPAGSSWTATLPIVVRSGALQMGEKMSDKVGFDSVETHRMADAFEVLDAIEPELASCVRGIDKNLGVRSILVGGRVAADGRNQCALASSPSATLPPKVADCLAGVLRVAKFPPPKGGAGLVLVPIHLMR